jgi:hypothetical protein
MANLNAVTTDLTVIGIHTPTPKVFWKGAELNGVVGIEARFTGDSNRVVITLKEDNVVSEMQSQGIIVKRI